MPKLSLIAKFSITSLILLAGISVLLGWGVTRQFEQQALEEQKSAVSVLVPPVIGPFLTRDMLANGARGQSYESIDRALSYLGGLGLVRVKVWNKQGMVVFSDDTSLVGKYAPISPEVRQALDGRSAAALTYPSEQASVQDLGYGALLKVYTPLQLPGSSEIGAAFEGYYDAEDLTQRLDDLKGFLWTAIAFSFLFVYTSLFTLVYNASHKLTQQNAENALLYGQSQQRLAERIQAEAETQRQVERLGALRSIDMAILASLDLRVTLDVILDQVCKQLQVDAAAILLLNMDTVGLTFAAGRGFRSNGIRRSFVRPGEGYAGSAVLQRKNSGVVRLAAGDQTRATLLAGEEFDSYCVVPLIVKGQVKGVLEVFHRSPLAATEEWTNFMEALAGQTAVAVDNATLFNDLQQSNLNLALAYDKTLEGWSRALDLRDKETEGHTQRVTEMTVRLARFMGVPESEIVNIRRGALLHDIGKMGVPDAILLKPGKLTDEEWEIMKKHPVYALELLSPVPFLKPALDIPYFHHEKWDGSGYPRKLGGEEIPLAARIFAVVDVWDALSSDRPYRKAMPPDEVYAYIAGQSGSHFDPRVVNAFLRMQGYFLTAPLSLAETAPRLERAPARV